MCPLEAADRHNQRGLVSGLVAYMESPDFGAAVQTFVKSQDDFDPWFKRCLAEATGVDLNNPPEMKPPELLSSYQA